MNILYSVTKSIVLIVVLAFSGCTSLSMSAKKRSGPVSETEIVCGLGDDELNFLGQRLGCHVEALGMSDYLFTCPSYSFHVLAHNEMSSHDRIRADQPILLRCELSGRKHPLESEFPIVDGVTLSSVEEHFRDFARKVELEGRRSKGK
jgi:hypothetical protein